MIREKHFGWCVVQANCSHLEQETSPPYMYRLIWEIIIHAVGHIGGYNTIILFLKISRAPLTGSYVMLSPTTCHCSNTHRRLLWHSLTYRGWFLFTSEEHGHQCQRRWQSCVGALFTRHMQLHSTIYHTSAYMRHNSTLYACDWFLKCNIYHLKIHESVVLSLLVLTKNNFVVLCAC